MKDTNHANFQRDVIQSPVPVIVDFWAPWCQPCNMLTPILLQVEQRFGGNLTVLKIDVDQNKVVAGQYHVQSIPTLLLFSQGRAVNRYVGNPGSVAAIETWVRKTLGI